MIKISNITKNNWGTIRKPKSKKHGESQQAHAEGGPARGSWAPTPRVPALPPGPGAALGALRCQSNVSASYELINSAASKRQRWESDV